MHGTRASSSKKAVGPRCREALSQTQRLQGRVPNRSVARKLRISADSQARHNRISRGLRRAFCQTGKAAAASGSARLMFLSWAQGYMIATALLLS